MRVKFTMEWTEEITDEALVEWAKEEGIEPEDDNEEIDVNDLKSQWLEYKADGYSDDPGSIPQSITLAVDYDVQ